MESKSFRNTFIAGLLVLLFANTIAAGAEWCTAALQNISNNFPDVSYSVISLILNIPNLCAAVLSVVSGMIVNRKIGFKPLMLIAIAFHCVGGIIPAFFGRTSIGMVLFGRFIFGIGYGLMQGIGISMSFKLIKDEKLRAHAMGWAVAAQYAMNLIAQLLVGFLSDIQWYWAFFVYFWGILPFIVVLIFCPRFEKSRKVIIDAKGNKQVIDEGESLLTTFKKLPATVWIFSIFTAVFMFAYYPFFLTISKVVMERGFGTGGDTGIAMTFYAVFTILGGVLYGFLQKRLKHLTLCVCLIGVAISMLGLYFSTSFTMVCCCTVLSGIMSPGVIPACVNVIYGSVPLNRSFVASGLAACGVNAGAFFTTPYLIIFEKLGKSTVDALFVSAIIMVIFGFVTITFCKRADREKAEREAAEVNAGSE
ncbi:MAG: MFS transporter [Lachnospiraceae bacterium]|jgi:MFS family permease